MPFSWMIAMYVYAKVLGTHYLSMLWTKKNVHLWKMKFYPSLHKKNFGKDFFEGFPFPDNPPRQINGPALNIFIQEPSSENGRERND